jgi:hypothetical protein
MENTKLKLEYITPYLPHGLKIFYDDVPKTQIIELGPNHFDVNWRLCFSSKPILRPLTDLNKEIEHNGKIFVPFIELAKIELGDLSNNELSDKIEENDYSLEIELLPSWFTLFFNKKNVTFSRWDDGEGMGSCSNNLLFKLFEWHFDVFGLIEKGLAKNILELETETSNKAQK